MLRSSRAAAADDPEKARLLRDLRQMVDLLCMVCHPRIAHNNKTSYRMRDSTAWFMRGGARKAKRVVEGEVAPAKVAR